MPIHSSAALVEIADAAKARDADAFAQLLHKHSSKLIRTKYPRLPSSTRKYLQLLLIPTVFSATMLIAGMAFRSTSVTLWILALVICGAIGFALLVPPSNAAAAQITDGLQSELAHAQSRHPEINAWVVTALTRSTTVRLRYAEWRFLKLSLLELANNTIINEPFPESS